ncbi:protein GlmU [Desulfobotulus sp. H1]|uniref:Protein GlmU n=1 Tax=Desulfobotulus pelophilus TaxID=2823377 RepID=A0ABT3NCD9_9BACT|nr:protein GlmU [Desulfobotulus pelophilus]MCW7755122.1 protein GlmU [Desulfobotulus pelophilus]
MPDPSQVFIADDIREKRIESGVTLHPGTRISGSDTLILRGSCLGGEGSTVLHNVRTGCHVHLKGGYFQEAVFLEGAQAGSGSHVRGGTILEERASIAHSVGLKQTILFPYVTLGSQINFCDILMAGGTGPDNHSEVGSSYIHFNFTPNQDKATASLIGDVPSGVMLNKPPVFLGGQGGLVGPCRLAFGTVVAAGTLQRKDELRENRLIFGSSLKAGNVERVPGKYPGLKKILQNNFTYIANLHALREWYRHVRHQFLDSTFPFELYEGLLLQVESGIAERIKRLIQLRNKVAAFHGEEKGIGRVWSEKADTVCALLGRDTRETESRNIIRHRADFLQTMKVKESYLSTLASMDDQWREAGRSWLQSLVDDRLQRAWEILSAQ